MREGEKEGEKGVMPYLGQQIQTTLLHLTEANIP